MWIPNLKETVYTNYVDSQKGHLENAAIYTTDGEMVTHGRLISEIESVASILNKKYSSGDLKIGILSSHSYQEAVFFLAANKIGVVSKFLDYTKNLPNIRTSIRESSITFLAISEEFLPIEPVINPQKLPVVIMGHCTSASPNCISYDAFLQEDTGTRVPTEAYCHQKPSIIVNSSGTTGVPKPIVITDYAINNAIKELLETDLPLNRDHIILKNVPLHIAMGSITTLYLGLTTGMPVLYLAGGGPKESLESFVQMFLHYDKFLQQHGIPATIKLCSFASPMFYRALYESRNFIDDLSFVDCMLAGGAGMTKEELELYDDAFHKKGCSVPVVNGYGQNEMTGTVTLNQIHQNRRGSAGKPLHGVDVLVVHPETMEPLPANCEGTILECSETVFLEYENMLETTNDAFVIDRNGKKWFNTKDSGYLDDDGFLYITGRNSRAMIRFDLKVSLDYVEQKMRKSHYIKDVAVISPDGNRMAAYVVLYNEFANKDVEPQMILDDIQNGPDPLTPLETLDNFIIMDSLPLTMSGKTDYQKLQKMSQE